MHDLTRSGLALIAAILGAFWSRSKIASKRRESRRIAELAGVALDLVRNQEIAHHTDPVRSPHAFVSSMHLRDMVLQDEHNIRERVRLWSKVARIVEGNANIRANVEEVAGDETRVWRWVGACKSILINRVYPWIDSFLLPEIVLSTCSNLKT
jgi:hypothetical protein